jgi:hypothetical protein
VRVALQEALGLEGFVDAVAVASNFQRMVRIADSTGIPLDAPVEAFSEDIREELDLSRFGGAANTPGAGPIQKLAGRLLRPLAPWMMRMAGRQLARRSGPKTPRRD